jgi:hypothetical protein
MPFVCCTAPPPTSSRFRRETRYGGCCPDSGSRWCLGRRRRTWDRPTDRPPAPWRVPGVCGLHRGPGSAPAAPVPLRRPGLHRGRRSRSAPRIATNAATSGPYGDDPAICPLDRASLRGRHARNRAASLVAGTRLRSRTGHKASHQQHLSQPGPRGAGQESPGAGASSAWPAGCPGRSTCPPGRQRSSSRTAGRPRPRIRNRAGRPGQRRAEDGVPGFDRSFTMHPRPWACVQDRPGGTSAATPTLTVTE